MINNKGLNHQVLCRLFPSYTLDLNNGAWSVYRMSMDKEVFNKALEWSKRANEFYVTPETIDTYAHLLFKTGNKDEALLWEKKAIDLKQKNGYDATNFVKVWKKCSRIH